MRCMRSKEGNSILVGRIFDGRLQVIMPDGIESYQMDTHFDVSRLRDVVVCGTVKDDTVVAKNIYPITDDSCFIEDRDIRLFIVNGEDLTDREEAGGFLKATLVADNKKYNLRILNTKGTVYHPDGYQVFITRKMAVGMQSDFIYTVEQIA